MTDPDPPILPLRGFAKGVPVRITFEGQTVTGVIELASPNERSLMLRFEAMLWTKGNGFAGLMPVLQDDDGVYRDIMFKTPVIIEKVEAN